MMNNKLNTIVMLEYSIKRYQAMGLGAKCQDLHKQLNMLKNERQHVRA